MLLQKYSKVSKDIEWMCSRRILRGKIFFIESLLVLLVPVYQTHHKSIIELINQLPESSSLVCSILSLESDFHSSPSLLVAL
jgi:hypothetical protein